MIINTDCLRPIMYSLDISGALVPAGMLTPLKYALKRASDLSACSATITIPESDPDISVGQLLGIRYPVRDQRLVGATEAVKKLYDFDDLYIVTKIQTDYTNARQRQITCSHCWQILSDLIIPGEVKPSTMGGSSTKVRCDLALTYLLAKEDAFEQMFGLNFVTGDISSDYAAIKQGWHFENVSIMDALTDISACLKNPVWTVRYQPNASTTDGKTVCNVYVDLDAEPSEAVCELRETRNLKSLSVSVDRSKMINVLYPYGKNNKNISGSDAAEETVDGYTVTHAAKAKYVYCQESMDTWGPKVEVKTESNISDAEALRDWAFAELENACTPIITVSADAMELAQVTGMDIDVLAPGTVCRISLPQYGATLQDIITSVDYSDLCADTVSVKITMSNERDTVKSVIYKMSGGSGSGSKKGDTNNETDHCSLQNQVTDATTKINNIQTERGTQIAGYDTQWIEVGGATVLARK